MSSSELPGSSPHQGFSRLRLIVRQKIGHHSATILSLAVRAASVIAGFAVTFLIGARYGASANGQFALVSQTVMFLSIVGLAGLDVGVVRHFSKSMADKAPLAAAAVIRAAAFGFVLISAISICLWLGSDLLWSIMFGSVVPLAMLPVVCALLFTRAGTLLLGGMLRSQHRFTLGQLTAALWIPLASALALAGGLVTSAEGALWAGAVGGLIAILVGAASLRHHMGSGEEAIDVSLKSLIASSLPLWGVGVAINIGDWYGLAVAAKTMGAAETGLYRVGSQIASTMQIVTMTIFSVYTPRISTAFHAGDHKQVAMLARSAMRVGVLLSLPMTAALLILGEPLLAQIGSEFRSAYSVLAILVVGNLIYVVFGPSGVVLAMAGRERINLAITVLATGLLIICMPIAAHHLGIEGIAITIAATMLFRNILTLAAVHRVFGINMWTGTVSRRAAT